jgi:hypothetical protein
MRLAQKHEKWAILLQILKWQKRLIELDNYENDTLNAIRLYEEERSIVEKIELEGALWKTKSKVFSELFAKGQARTAIEAKSLEDEIDNTAQIKSGGPRSFEALYLINHIKSAFYFATVNYKKCHKVLKSNAQLIEQNLEMVRDEPSVYISVLTNLIYVSAKLNKFRDADDYLNKLRSLPPSLKKRLSENLELRIFTNTYSLELAICNLTGNVNRGTKLIDELEPRLEMWESKLSEVRKASFYHQVSTLLFLNSDMHEALKWNNRLLNTINIDQSEDQVCFGHILHILIHYELENSDVVKHALKTLSRYVKTRSRNYKFEVLFIDCMKSLVSDRQGEHRKERLTEFLEKCRELENDPFEKTAFEYFDFVAWAESRVDDTEMAEVVKNRAPLKNVL